MPAQSGFTDSYWMGYLAHTVTEASRSADPKPLLRSAVGEFLRNHPPEHAPLAARLRAILREKK